LTLAIITMEDMALDLIANHIVELYIVLLHLIYYSDKKYLMKLKRYNS